MGDESRPVGPSGRSASRRRRWLALAVTAAVVLSAAVSGVLLLTATDDSDTRPDAETGTAEGTELLEDTDDSNTSIPSPDAETSTAGGTELLNDGDLDCATSESKSAVSPSYADPGSDGSPSPSDWLALPRDPPTGEGPTAEELSTGPRLRWTEIAAGPEETLGLEQGLRLQGTSVGGGERISLESVGDGRVLVRVGDDRTARYFVTWDGTAWTKLPMPEGIRVSFVRGSGSTWAVVGFDPQEEMERKDANRAVSILSPPIPYAPEFRVFASDDGGVRWAEVELDTGPGTPHVIDVFVHPSALLVSGECIVVPIILSRYLDWSSLLADRRLIANGLSAECWAHAEDSVLRCLEFSPDVDDEIASQVEAVLLHLLAAGDPDDVVNWDGVDAMETLSELLDELPGIALLEVAIDELDLTEDQQAVLMAHVTQTEMLGEESPTGFGFHRFGFADLFTTRVFVGGRSGLTPGADLQGWPYSSLTTPGGFLLHVVGTTNVVADSPDGRHWRETPVDASPPSFAVSFTVLEPFTTLQPLGGVAADGTVWGRAWVDGGGLAMSTLRIGEAPMIERVFEGLGPGPRLEDMAAGPAGLATAATRRWVDEEDQHHSRTLVGWSADGAQWGWQSTAEAFGIRDEYLGELPVAVELAVGADFVLALMEENENFTRRTLRWFIAPIPSQE